MNDITMILDEKDDMPKPKKLKEGYTRRIIPPGYQVRRALGRDEEEGVVRVQLVFTLEEWDEIEYRAAKKGLYPRQWLMVLVKKKIGSSSR